MWSPLLPTHQVESPVPGGSPCLLCWLQRKTSGHHLVERARSNLNQIYLIALLLSRLAYNCAVNQFKRLKCSGLGNGVSFKAKLPLNFSWKSSDVSLKKESWNPLWIYLVWNFSADPTYSSVPKWSSTQSFIKKTVPFIPPKLFLSHSLSGGWKKQLNVFKKKKNNKKQLIN